MHEYDCAAVCVCLYLHHHHLDGDVLGQPDGSLEVHGQSHQQVNDGHQVLGVDGCDRERQEAAVSAHAAQPDTMTGTLLYR